MLSIASSTQRASTSVRVASALGCSFATKYVAAQDYEYLADLALDDALDDEDLLGIDVQLESYLLDAEIGRLASRAKLTTPDASAKLMADFLTVHKHHGPTRVLCDEEAMFWIIGQAMADSRFVSESAASRSARAAAHDLIYHQLISQKVAPGAFKKVYKAAPMRGSAPAMASNYEEWVEAAEDLQLRAQPMWVKYCRLWAAPPRRVREHVRRMIDKVDESSPMERHKISAFSKVMEGSSSYNYAGVLVTFFEKTMLVMDGSLADYIRTCLTSLRNATWAFSMMRVSGDNDTHSYSMQLRRCIMWIRTAIADTRRARYVARHMHLAYTRWQNAVGEKDSPINCGWEERDKHLEADMRQMHPFTSTWYNLVMSLHVPERTRAEFFKLYHLLPPPDIDPLLLHNSLVERTSSENKCNPDAVASFINFCKSYDLARFLSKRKKDPKTESVEGYIAHDMTWYKTSRSGKLTLPPKQDWGKVWMSKEFPYDPTGDFHIFDSKDCTRVVADLGAYMDRSRSRDLSRMDQNELLSAVFNGPVLSNGEYMHQWRKRVMDGKLRASDHIIAAEAGKAENTKPGSKVRETLSASDNAREFLTEVDHSIRPLAELTPGVSIRVDLVKHKRKFQAMARATSAISPQSSFATSTDISGWSPKMPRAMFHAWQTYALGTTECPNPKSPIALWDKLVLFADRRGVKVSNECRNGNIQGWPATSDTTMHAHILIRWAYMLREEKVLSAREAAYTLCLIDDAATVVALEGTPEECVQKAQRARDLLAELYLSLGFVMDEVKSFFSAVKFVYLNELYVDGTQVAHATKTMMRIDKDYTRRFSSLTDNIATAFGTASSAASQGADPFVAYFLAAWLSYKWVFKLDPELMKVPTHILTIYALAPVSLNGLGIKAITSCMATGEIDHLTWFIEIIGHMCATVQSDMADKVFSNFLLQKPVIRDAHAVFVSPFTYAAASHSSAQAAIADSFRTAARNQGMAEPFKSLDKITQSAAYSLALEAVMKSSMHEAALLEEVSSCMPEAFIDEVMARIDRTELISFLLGGRSIGDLRRRVHSADMRNIQTAKDILMSAYQTHGSRNMKIEFENIGSFEMAKSLRDAAFVLSGYQVINHTYPCPFSLWAFKGHCDLDDPSVRGFTTVSFDLSRLRKTIGSNTKNMYDSATAYIGYRGYRTIKSNTANEARVLLYNPVRKKMHKVLLRSDGLRP